MLCTSFACSFLQPTLQHLKRTLRVRWHAESERLTNHRPLLTLSGEPIMATPSVESSRGNSYAESPQAPIATTEGKSPTPVTPNAAQEVDSHPPQRNSASNGPAQPHTRPSAEPSVASHERSSAMSLMGVLVPSKDPSSATPVVSVSFGSSLLELG